MRAKKPSKHTKLCRVLSDIQSKRDALYKEYMCDLLSFDEYLQREVILAIKERSLQFKIDQVSVGNPENGTGPSVHIYNYKPDPNEIN